MEVRLTFNASNINFKLNGQNIDFQPSVTHLGHHVENPEWYRKGISDLFARTNSVLSKFGSCNSEVRHFLVRTYCTSFYGSPLWNLSGSHIQRFYCAWRKCVRRVWNVPYNTHCRFMEQLSICWAKYRCSIATKICDIFLGIYIYHLFIYSYYDIAHLIQWLGACTKTTEQNKLKYSCTGCS